MESDGSEDLGSSRLKSLEIMSLGVLVLESLRVWELRSLRRYGNLRAEELNNLGAWEFYYGNVGA